MTRNTNKGSKVVVGLGVFEVVSTYLWESSIPRFGFTTTEGPFIDKFR